MKLSTNPAVWRVALTSILAALVSAGVLSPELGESVDGTLGTLAIVAAAVLPIVGAIWARSRTAPVASGTPQASELIRGSDGVYRSVAEARAHELGTDVAAAGGLDRP